MEIGRPWYLDVTNEDPTTMEPNEEEETLKAVSTTDQALGCLLMDVMHFVSNGFDWHRHTLSVMNGGCAYPRPMDGVADPMIIEDPLRRVNNVGRSCFRFKELQRICGDVLLSLSKTIVRSEYEQTEKGETNLLKKIRTFLFLHEEKKDQEDQRSKVSSVVNIGEETPE